GADDEQGRAEAGELVHRHVVGGVVDQDALAGGPHAHVAGKGGGHEAVDAGQQLVELERAGHVVANDDVGGGSVEVDVLGQVLALEQQQVLGHEVGRVGN